MKTIKNSLHFFPIFVLLLWSCQSEAQRPALKNVPAEKIAEMQTQNQVKQLNLEEQKAKQLETINLKYAKELKTLNAQGRLRDHKDKLKALNQAQNKEVEAILSPSEFEQYKAVKQKQRKRLKTKMQENRTKMQERREEQIARLDMTEEQLAQMKEIRQKYAEQKRALRKERSRETLQRLKDINERQNNEVKSILSEEQYQEYLKMMEENRKRFRENRGQQQFRDRKE